MPVMIEPDHLDVCVLLGLPQRFPYWAIRIYRSEHQSYEYGRIAIKGAKDVYVAQFLVIIVS